MKLKIASWNIAGGRRIQSNDQFDYEKQENLPYFVNEIKQLDPDIVCLQETHTNDQRSMANDMAQMLNMPFVFNSPASPSHVNADYQLSNAIVSKFVFTGSSETFYPNPWFDAHLNGKKIVQHAKNLQIVTINGLHIANTQLSPLRIFGYEYDSGLGRELAIKMEQILLRLKAPLLFAGDFNFNFPQTIYPTLFQNLQLSEAFPDTVTRPDGKSKYDHIYYTNEFKLIEAKVVPTMSDHYLCYAAFETE
jgi:endonuclease/exonuclease/phosphatase family metal-dependent hydrolase